jgi:hypothetical protein
MTTRSLVAEHPESQIPVSREQIAEFCRRNRIR